MPERIPPARPKASRQHGGASQYLEAPRPETSNCFLIAAKKNETSTNVVSFHHVVKPGFVGFFCSFSSIAPTNSDLRMSPTVSCARWDRSNGPRHSLIRPLMLGGQFAGKTAWVLVGIPRGDVTEIWWFHMSHKLNVVYTFYGIIIDILMDINKYHMIWYHVMSLRVFDHFSFLCIVHIHVQFDGTPSNYLGIRWKWTSHRFVFQAQVDCDSKELFFP